MQVQVVERAQQIMLQEQEITRREMELEAKVKKPADAERYRLEKLAEAQRWVITLCCFGATPLKQQGGVVSRQVVFQFQDQSLKAPVFVFSADVS